MFGRVVVGVFVPTQGRFVFFRLAAPCVLAVRVFFFSAFDLFVGFFGLLQERFARFAFMLQTFPGQARRVHVGVFVLFLRSIRVTDFVLFDVIFRRTQVRRRLPPFRDHVRHVGSNFTVVWITSFNQVLHGLWRYV